MAPAEIQQQQVTIMAKNRFTLSQSAEGGGESPQAGSHRSGSTAVAPLPSSDAETAHQLFVEEVGRLPGVLQVEQWGEEESGFPTFHIYLRPDDRDTEYAVYEVKGRVYDRFPDAYLDVVVLEASDGPRTNGEPGP
jgi:hypothetical protein